MSAQVRIRRMADGDLDALVPLNNSAVPAVNALRRADLARFATAAAHFRIAAAHAGGARHLACEVDLRPAKIVQLMVRDLDG